MITLEKDGGLWIATINRPEKANSLTFEMLDQLADIAEAAQEARALILTGTGKVFSAGMDLEAAKTDLPLSPVWERLSTAITALVLACDIRLAVPGAKAFYPVMKLGFLPQPSDPARLATLIGPARAKLILMGGHKTTTDEALAWGLFDQLAAPEVLMQSARDLAADTLGATADHATAIKGLIG